MVTTRRGPVSEQTSSTPSRRKAPRGLPTSAKKVKNKVASPSPRGRAKIVQGSDIDSDEFNYEDEASATSYSIGPEPSEDASATSSTKRKRLPGNLLKQLAIDIQAQGGIRNFSLTSTQALRDICGARTELYGPTGDYLRERIRKKVFAWKTLDDLKYVEYLRKKLKLTDQQIKPRGVNLVNEGDLKPAAVEEDHIPASVRVPKKSVRSVIAADSKSYTARLDANTQGSKMSTYANTTYITVNEKKPECNGPFLINPVPDFPGVDPGKEYKGYYIILGIDNRFVLMDDETNWYSASVTSDGKKVTVKVPGVPYTVFPKGPHSTQLYDNLTGQVPACVAKSMHNAHSDFDQQDGTAADTATIEGRKWKYYELDFSKCTDFEGELSAQKLSRDAGEKEVLDFDLLCVPATWTKSEKGDLIIQSNEEFLGFKVANIDSQSQGRKTQRSGQAKSKLAQKRAAAMNTVAHQDSSRTAPKPEPVSSGAVPRLAKQWWNLY